MITDLFQFMNFETEELKEKVENLTSDIIVGYLANSIVIQYHDWMISTWNPLEKPIIDENGKSNWYNPQVHPCSKKFSELESKEYKNDYITDYITTCF